jgi:hypothetical protein
LAVKDIISDGGTDTLEKAAKRQIEMSPNSYAKQCGVCHAGGGQLEYDRDMNQYGSGSATGDRYTWLNVALNGSSTVNGQIVDISATPAIQTTSLYGDNKAEVDCLLCHMSETRPNAAYYKNTLGCGDTNMTGPADNPNCGSNKVVFMDMKTGVPTMMPDNRFQFAIGDFYDSYNRNIAMSLGLFKQAASAGLGAGVNLQTGDISGMPTTLAGANIATSPKSANCAQCHARNEADNIGLPGEAQVFGGMTAAYGNFVRLTAAGQAFDFDKIAADGTCTTGCTNDTRWFEFGCKTGMGKRAQRTGVGSQDRWANGFCLICDSQNQWGDPTSFCALPSVQADCIAKSGIPTLISDNNPMTLVDMTPQGPMPKLIPGKMPDTDVHDASSMTCTSCHYAMSGNVAARTITGNGATYTYPATTLEKMDHNLAKGYSMLEKVGDGYEGTVSCASCHIAGENNHPNAAALNAPIAGHAGFPALHFEKIDCRTCHIPQVYASPGRLLFRDWTAGAYRQTEGSNGNANHFEFGINMLEGSAAPIAPARTWVTTPEGTKITGVYTSLLPIWAGSAIRASDDVVLGWSPAKTRDITAAAAIVAKNNPALGIRINGTNDHPPFQGFQLTDPMKIESKAKIDLMATELGNASRTGAGSHGTVRDPRINLNPIFFDVSHGVPSKEWALGSPSKGGCIMCHSSSAINPMTGQPVDPATYSPYSVGFFDGSKELLQNGMMQMANYDCDNPYIFTMMTTGQTTTLATPTCIETTPPPYGTGLCDGTARGTTSTGAMNGTMGLCKQQIGGGLAQQMGMTPDAMLRMDGVEFMQMMAIREGGSAPTLAKPNGCNPMMQIFGLPTGCDGSEYYSRAEIKLYFAKSLEQSTFTPVVAGSNWTNPITGLAGTVPTTMGRVTGLVSVAKNPSNPAHANKFDLGATCRNPLDGSRFPCSYGMPGMTNLIDTAVSAKQLLGYTSATLDKLMNGSAVSTMNCTGCHNASSAPAIIQGTNHHSGACTTCHETATYPLHQGVIVDCGACHTAETITGMNHLSAAGTPSTCATCHLTPGVAPDTQATCGQCHGGSAGSGATHNGARYVSLTELTAFAFNMHNTKADAKPVAKFSWATDPTTDYNVLFDASGSTCTGTCTYSWVFGDGGSVSGLTIPTTSRVYTTGATAQTAVLTVANGSGSTSYSVPVVPKFVGSNKVVVTSAIPTQDGSTASVVVVSSGGTGTITSKVSWGDGATETKTGHNQTFGPHTYSSMTTYKGSIFVTDSGVNGQYKTSDTKPFSVTFSPMSISGLVTKNTGSVLSGVSLTLKQGGVAKRLSTSATSGRYTFTSVAPGTYTVTATKTGYTFLESAPVSATTTNLDFQSAP